MKAWSVGDGQYSIAVRAPTRGKAKFAALKETDDGEFFDCDYIDLSATRIPFADGEGDVSKRLLIDNGWSWGCDGRGCWRDVDQDTAGRCYDPEGRVYCSEGCRSGRSRARMSASECHLAETVATCLPWATIAWLLVKPWMLG